ncbi:ecto-NOX disulfide-thiol exchanger 2-like isoform X2 [Anarrhichthys ocellatus]|uniref:ecto-NOX disulfide-thiol exchanger 2-like isoform X2 n=1 Tax=Anarrhichthys ocellatus TaxID=433405 RepID=UPI0012EE3132|nr:ecto-NOX disulfide-thiol exchanger 2-like isoform X2 [Anarrhichthys ocellatus]
MKPNYCNVLCARVQWAGASDNLLYDVNNEGLNSLPFDAASNNDPLHFSSSSGPLVTECPPLESTVDNSKKRKRASLPPEGICNMTMDSNSMTMTMPMPDPNPWATAMNNLGMPPIGITGQQLMPDFDPSLGMMPGITPLNPMMPGLGMVPPPLFQDLPVIKEIIHCKSCTLFPPNPNLPPPAMRERPPGCKTVFVGGLPENATEQLIVEIFGQCGEITAIRKSKKNFCHIRFAEEFTVDKALYLSGYRIRLGSSTDKKDSGRLHVDFAQARDDLYEWECRQRMFAREERHRRKIEEDRLRPPSPPPIVHYSEHESSQLGDKIKDDNAFPEAVHVLLTWLERGEVNRRNANNFYSMIQSSNGHIRRLTGEKSQHEKEVEEAKDKFKTALAGIVGQFEQIVSVFQAASKQKAWDHFSKAQRKNLDMWRKQAEEIRNMHSEQLMGIRREEEMEMSDDDMEDSPDSKDSEDSAVFQAEALKEENDSLRCQLDAYRNEVELLKQEQGKNQPIGSEEDNTHSQQLSFLQQALQGMQKQLLKMRDELKQREAELEKSFEDKQQLNNQVLNLKEGLQNLQNTHVMQLETSKEDDGGSEESANQTSEATVSTVVSCSQEKEGPTERNPPSPVHSEREALLVGIISTFLHVHPFGASIEYICSYLQRLDTKINTGEVEALLSRLPCTFRQELTGVGASLEKRWNFCGFQGIKST